MTDNKLTPEAECPVCHEDRDPTEIVDHAILGPCCYWCACHHDFPADFPFEHGDD